MKTLFAVLAGALSIVAFEAQATPPAYVCMSMTAPSALDPTLGRSGYVGFYTSANPDCGGVTAQYIVCSAGATNSACGSHAQYTDAGLQTLSEALQNANWLTRSLEQRARTILKVATEIVRQQDGFFAHVVAHLRPLNLKTVAEAIGMHFLGEIGHRDGGHAAKREPFERAQHEQLMPLRRESSGEREQRRRRERSSHQTVPAPAFRHEARDEDRERERGGREREREAALRGADAERRRERGQERLHAIEQRERRVAGEQQRETGTPVGARAALQVRNAGSVVRRMTRSS